ncbi:MAG: bifunctional oligoribonuclease/PAP phosphatase NrnA [Bacillota bacterium]
MEATLNHLAEYIRARDGFCVVAHTSPDGDTLGSSLALFLTLKKLGKRAVVVCDQPIPAIYRFLPEWDQVRLPSDAPQMENVIAVDCADIGRLGAAGTLFENARSTANIDHHSTNDSYAQINALNTKAAATGEIMFRLVGMLLTPLDRSIALCLYTALTTDTGNFSYSNTTPDTFRIAAELLEYGVDNAMINRMIYRTIPLRKMKLMGYAVSNMELVHGGKIGVSVVRRNAMEKIGAADEDTEGIIDHIRDVDTVEVAILFWETKDGDFKVSLRSKAAVDVSRIAARFQGGGHPRAAGLSASGGFDEVYSAVVRAVIEAMEG